MIKNLSKEIEYCFLIDDVGKLSYYLYNHFNQIYTEYYQRKLQRTTIKNKYSKINFT